VQAARNSRPPAGKGRAPVIDLHYGGFRLFKLLSKIRELLFERGDFFLKARDLGLEARDTFGIG
jgi:hypothetical protein